MKQSMEQYGKRQAISFLNENGYSESEYVYHHATELPDPDTDECKGYEYVFRKEDKGVVFEIRIWYEADGRVSNRGRDKINVERYAL